MNRCTTAFAVLIGVCAAAPGWAQDAPPELPGVLVQESALPISERDWSEDEAREVLRATPGGVGFVGEETIERSRARDLEDVLRQVPGVAVRARGVGEEPRLSIRGSGLRSNFHGRGVNLLLDGFPLHNADGSSDFESIELLAVRRIEVYKDASSLRFGGGALGGAINLVTHAGPDAEPLALRTEVGSFGYVKSYAQGAIARGPADAFAAISHTRSNGYRDHAEGNRQRLYASFGRAFAGGAALRLDVNGVRSRARLPGALTGDEYRDDPRRADPESRRQDAARDYELGRGALRLDLPLSGTQQLSWLAQIHYQDLWHPLPFAVIDNESLNATTELRWVATDPLLGRENRLAAGLQGAFLHQPQRLLENDEGADGPAFQRQTGRVGSLVAYVEDEWSPSERLRLVAGGRVYASWREVAVELGGDDLGSADYFAVSPRVGAIFSVTPEIELYANLGHANEPPVLFEATAPGNLDGRLDDLDAQRAWQFELGARGRLARRVAFDVAVWDHELRDEIRNVNVQPFPGAPFTIPRYENARRTRHWGVELGLDVALIEDALHLGLSYTGASFRYVDDPTFGDNRLPGEPAHHALVELRLRHPSGFWTAPRVEVASRAYADSANTRDVGGFALLGLRAGWEHAASGLGLFFEARNLTDERYVSSVLVDGSDDRFREPGDGRAFTGGISWRWR